MTNRQKVNVFQVKDCMSDCKINTINKKCLARVYLTLYCVIVFSCEYIKERESPMIYFCEMCFK